MKRPEVLAAHEGVPYILAGEPTEELLAQAVWSCLKHGAVILKNSVETDNIDRISREWLVAETTISDDPELAELPIIGAIHQALGCWRNPWGVRYWRSSTAHGQKVASQKFESHTDNMIDVIPPESVLTLIVPARGNPADFYVGDSKFSVPYGLHEGTLYLGRYGVGDALLLRQRVEFLNGRFVSIDQAHHLGLGISNRNLGFVDFCRGGNKLDVPEIPSLAA